MCRSLAKVHWENPAHAVTAFVTVMVMPLTYSIAYGLLAGIGTWFAVKAVAIPLYYAFGIEDPTVIKEEGEGEVEEEAAKAEAVKEENEFSDDAA